jgi:hypothetical protein
MTAPVIMFLHLARARARARGKSQQFRGFRRSNRRRGMAQRAENGHFDHFRGRSACRFRRNRSPASLETAVFRRFLSTGGDGESGSPGSQGAQLVGRRDHRRLYMCNCREGLETWSLRRGGDAATIAALSPLHTRRTCRITRDLVTSQAINWGNDPLARGAYSYATPKTREAQLALGKSDGSAIFFSGEALSGHDDHRQIHKLETKGRRKLEIEVIIPTLVNIARAGLQSRQFHAVPRGKSRGFRGFRGSGRRRLMATPA